MLSRSHRLPPSRIPVVMRLGKRITGDEITLIVLKGEADTSRFSRIVPVKIDKRATARNRMKRLLSESIARLLPRFRDPQDCILVAKKNFSHANQRDIDAKLQELFHI